MAKVTFVDIVEYSHSYSKTAVHTIAPIKYRKKQFPSYTPFTVLSC